MKFIKRIIVLLCITPIFSYAQPNPRLLVLTDATIIDAAHPIPATHQTVVIVDGRITKIFSTGAASFPDSAIVINLKGKYLLPGLMDSHVHMATDPGGTDNRAHTLQILKQMLFSGITTV